jgi:hypothetical protein
MLLKTKVDEAYNVTSTISSMDLRADFRSSFNSNRSSLQSLKTQLGGVGGGSRTGSSGGSGSSGCYIATMAYGDYEHPQVLELRKFRDEVLLKSNLGTYLVKIYYKVSPRMVEILKNQKSVNSAIRGILNLIVNIIKK